MTPCPTCGRSTTLTDAQLLDLLRRRRAVLSALGARLGYTEPEIARAINEAEPASGWQPSDPVWPPSETTP